MHHAPTPPPALDELGPFIVPTALYCPVAQEWYTPARLYVATPGVVQTHCPLCDQWKRTGADPQYDHRQPEVHTYFLKRRPTIRQVRERIAVPYLMVRAAQEWRSN